MPTTRPHAVRSLSLAGLLVALALNGGCVERSEPAVAQGTSPTSGPGPSVTIPATATPTALFTVSLVLPASGPPAGGTAITVSGTAFQTGATVSVGGINAKQVKVVSSTTITCVTPAGTPGSAVVQVTNPGPASAALQAGFAYTPSGASVTNFGGNGVVTSDPTARKPDHLKAITHDGTWIYLGGADYITYDYHWRVEKRSMATGALDPNFGTGGAVRSNPEFEYDQVEALANDGTYLYIAGWARKPNSWNDSRWRIEKRLLSTGALVKSFGNGGVVDSDPTTSMDHVTAMVLVGPHLFVAGFENGIKAYTPRLEKRLLTTGALDTAFGVGGAVRGMGSGAGTLLAADGGHLYVAGYGFRPHKLLQSTGAVDARFARGWSWSAGGVSGATAMAVHGGHLYVAGVSLASVSGYDWRLEKRNTRTARLVKQFGTNGAVASTPGGWAVPYAIVTDGSHVWMAGLDGGARGYQFRVEKRSAKRGGLVTGFAAGGVWTRDPSATGDWATCIAQDATSLYVGGYDDTPGWNMPQWRVEKLGK